MNIGDHVVHISQEGRPTNGLVFETTDEGTIVSLVTLHRDPSKRLFLTQGDFHLGLERIYSVKTVHRVAAEAIQEENEKSEQYKRDAIPPTVEQLFPCVAPPDEVEIKDGVVIGFFIGLESLPQLYKVPREASPPQAPVSPSPEEANPAQVQAEPGTPATSTESGAQ